MQNSQANCGPTAVHNALLALGIKRSIDECEKLCGTNATEGTTPRRIIKALKSIEGMKPLEIRETREEVGLLLILDCLRKGRPAILSVDKNEHWVAAIGLLGERIHIADGADNELVISYTGAGLIERWWEGDVRKPFYAIVL